MWPEGAVEDTALCSRAHPDQLSRTLNVGAFPELCCYDQAKVLQPKHLQLLFCSCWLLCFSSLGLTAYC